MAVRPVVTYPARVLKRVARPVGAIGPAEEALARDLVDTMHTLPACVGLAAPQVDVPLRAFAIDVSLMRRRHANHGLAVLFDPEVLHTEGAEQRREGCVSLPEYTCDVLRSVVAVVRGTTPEGRVRVIAAEGFEARAIQHELDHLDGVLILDRVTARSDIFRRKRFAGPGEHLR